jgi:pyrrolysine biosynthesis protein PylC
MQGRAGGEPAMKMLVVGGKLQGTEICYLAGEAGWDVTLVDREGDVLASQLADDFLRLDINGLAPDFFTEFDVVFPATENLETLLALRDLCGAANVPYAFDEPAYRLSSSKVASNEFFAECGIPTPPAFGDAVAWDDGFVVKPDSASSSVGVRRCGSYRDAEAFLEGHPGYLAQAFVDGPVYSIEVVCDHGTVCAYLVTEVVVGPDYDCHRIVAPADIGPEADETIRQIAHTLGEALDMRGIFDIELVWRKGRPYVLEIDARMPSQTPIAIYHATGINLVDEVARLFSGNEWGIDEHRVWETHGAAVLQHVRISSGSHRNAVALIGEGELSDKPPLGRVDGFFGADAALACEDGESSATYATVVATARKPSAALDRIEGILDRIKEGVTCHDFA